MSSECTENELQDIVDQMGQHVKDAKYLHRLKNEIDRILNDEPTFSENFENNSVADQSLFASLCIDPERRPDFRRNREPSTPQTPIDVDLNYIPSPIQSRHRYRNEERYDDVDLPENSENFDSNNQEANSLISQAYQSINRIYKTCRSAEYLSKVMSSIASSEDPDAENLETVEDEELMEPSISISASEGEPSTPQKVVIIDPSVRPRLETQPGRAPLKFDPVTRYHLYREEWNRHPAPGEMRRLSLRWKVREFMLRNDVPRLDYGQVEHPKDWSPRPYMD